MCSHFWATKDLEDNRTNDRRGSLHKVSLGRCHMSIFELTYQQPTQAVWPVDERMIPHFNLPAFVLSDERPGQVRNIQ